MTPVRLKNRENTTYCRLLLHEQKRNVNALKRKVTLEKKKRKEKSHLYKSLSDSGPPCNLYVSDLNKKSVQSVV